jgi:hypothetical protein
MTLQQFLEKQASHTGKRVLFARKPGQNERKQLMDEYLKNIDDKEKEKHKVREEEFSSELSQLQRINKEE